MPQYVISVIRRPNPTVGISVDALYLSVNHSDLWKCSGHILEETVLKYP